MTPTAAHAAAAPTGGTVSLNSGSLNVRSAPSSQSAVVGKLPRGSHVTLISRSGDWWQVEYAKNRFGYCHNAYINNIGGSQRMVYTSSGALNVRSGPGTGYAKTASLHSGEKLIVLSSDGYWSKILYHGTQTGYVYNIYLGPVKSQSSTKAVSLSVPSFKQYDSRWKSVKIGTQGGTIGTIGCATTAIAMMESYRGGTTITPAVMKSRLSYTASGSVYWPAHYTAITSSANYLSRIYSLLSSGKPVMLGCKNSYGSQHWIVIKGFKGGNLTAANFIINDPGSATRTNLQQFLNDYPVFYKYFHY